MFKQFNHYKQRDAMDCGPTCLKMVAEHYGQDYTLTHLRSLSHLSREGVSAEGVISAAEEIGLEAKAFKIPFASPDDEGSLLIASFPLIAYWNQNHFVVVYKANKKYAWVADPAAGKIKLSRKDFEKSWVSDNGEGIVILLEPTPKFYNTDNLVVAKTQEFRYIFQYLRPHRGMIVQLLLGMLLVSGFNIIVPFLAQSVVDVGIENRKLDFISIVLIAQLILFVSQMSVTFLQNRILLNIGTRINVALVADFLKKLMLLPLSFFDAKMTGDLMQRINDQSRIESFLTQSSLSIIFSAVNFVIFSGILLQYNPSIFGVFMVATVLYVLWITFFLRKRKQIDYVRFQEMGQNNNVLMELIQGMTEIKLQGSERKRRTIWYSGQTKLFNISQKSLILGRWQEFGGSFFINGKDFFISVIAATAVINGSMTLGMMVATQYMVGQLNAPLQQFIGFLRSWQDAKISLERLGEIHDEPNEDDALGTMPVNPQNGIFTYQAAKGQDIHLENLSFRYNALDNPVLKNVNLTIPHGKVTAIVGTSGSGKTTLVKILLGFYRPNKGSIKLGKTNIRNITPSVWRKHCGAVMQDGFIFSDSISNNVAESDDYTDKVKLLRAMQIANIQEFVETMPLTYNTQIGQKGNGISQGQRQRLLIARAVYKDPDFLFFDEATNALDANNEKIIVENMREFYVDRTVVVVAHRLSTVRHADQIVVMEKGEIIEVGSHEKLVSLRGSYFNLIKNQLELGS